MEALRVLPPDAYVGAVEAMVVMEELGRGLVNAPYAAGALVAPSLLSQAPAQRTKDRVFWHARSACIIT